MILAIGRRETCERLSEVVVGLFEAAVHLGMIRRGAEVFNAQMVEVALECVREEFLAIVREDNLGFAIFSDKRTEELEGAIVGARWVRRGVREVEPWSRRWGCTDSLSQTSAAVQSSRRLNNRRRQRGASDGEVAGLELHGG